MTLPVLKKIEVLITGGAVVVGPKPVTTPGLSAYPSADNELTALAAALWGDLDGTSRTKRSYGKGKIVWGLPLQMVLREAGVGRDVDFNYDEEKASWIHRRDGNTDIYFVANRTNDAINLSGRFNINNKAVELWHPDKAIIEPATYTIDGTATHVTIALAAHEAVFVVFRNKALRAAYTPIQKQYVPVSEITGEWNISFPKSAGAPANVLLPQLASWTQSMEEGVKYFSGTATYTKTINIKKEWLQPGYILLNLGIVKDMAEVYVNGTRIDLLWHAPFEVDITNAVKAGNNKLEIKVTNEWTNRLAGDKEHPDHKVLDSYPTPFGARQYELTASGLIVPVTLSTSRKQ